DGSSEFNIKRYIADASARNIETLVRIKNLFELPVLFFFSAEKIKFTFSEITRNIIIVYVSANNFRCFHRVVGNCLSLILAETADEPVIAFVEKIIDKCCCAASSSEPNVFLFEN